MLQINLFFSLPLLLSKLISNSMPLFWSQVDKMLILCKVYFTTHLLALPPSDVGRKAVKVL